MKPPIYVYEPLDLTIFETVEAAENYIEPPEVEDGSLSLYDSDGRVLEAYVIQDSRGIERCKIREVDYGSVEPESLKEILVDYLDYLGRVHDQYPYSRQNLVEMTLDELVLESLKFKSD